VTKFISEIDFVNTAVRGEVIEIGLEPVAFGTTSVTLKCEVRNKLTKARIITIDQIVFVHVDERGMPLAHGEITEAEPA
jgi:acyl-CoA hydrolase